MAHLHAIEPEPADEGIVDLVRRLQALVDAGEVAAVGVAIVRRDGATQSLWSEGGGFARLLGATARLAHKLNRELDE